MREGGRNRASGRAALVVCVCGGVWVAPRRAVRAGALCVDFVPLCVVSVDMRVCHRRPCASLIGRCELYVCVIVCRRRVSSWVQPSSSSCV